MNSLAFTLAPFLAGIAGTGCVFVPNLSPVYRSKDVGDPSAALKIGVATREDVLARWGKPDFRSDHDLAFG